MKAKAYISAILVLVAMSCFGQKKGPVAYVGFASFTTPSGLTYFETYLTMSGNSLVYGKNDKGEYECKVNVSVQFSHNDSVKAADSYNMLSPLIIDTSKRLTFREIPDADIGSPLSSGKTGNDTSSSSVAKKDYAGKEADFSAVRRYWLPKGVYVLQIKIEDKNNPSAKIVSQTLPVNVGYRSDSIAISDAELLMSYAPAVKPVATTKSGYDMMPYVYSYYPPEMKTFTFYTEIYNTYKEFPQSKLAVKYYIEDLNTHVLIDGYSSVSVHQADSVIPVLGGFSIEKLRTGNYNLVVAVVNKKNQIVRSRSFGFYRLNPKAGAAVLGEKLTTIDISGTFAANIKSTDSLRDFVQYLAPIAGADELYFIDQPNSQTDTALLRRFFYNFWVTRNPSDPKGAWEEYYKQVKYVNEKFTTTTKKGFQTDRGRVYLHYGTPNKRVQSSINADCYPYEIWQYYKMNDGQVDKKFVFYEPSLATNDYILLHSTAIGEVQNRQWSQVLFSQNLAPATSVDQNNLVTPNQEERDVIDEFNNPR